MREQTTETSCSCSWSQPQNLTDHRPLKLNNTIRLYCYYCKLKTVIQYSVALSSQLTVQAMCTVYDQQPSMFFCIKPVFSLSSRFTLKSVLFFISKKIFTELKSRHLIFVYRNKN